MNYRHIYHAGNFADVFKHAVISLVLKSLHQKDNALCYLDTHAGAGRYDLSSAPAQKTGEFRDGISRWWNKNPPPGLADYLAAVRAVNEGRAVAPGVPSPATLAHPWAALRYYPGSPL